VHGSSGSLTKIIRQGRGNGTGRVTQIRKNRFQDRRVRCLSTTEGWKLEPEDEHSLEGEIPREIVKDDTKSETLKDIEETEYDLVGEPLDVILMSGCLERLEGKVCRQCPAYKV